MFFEILHNKIYGYVRIAVEGFFLEKFINICKINKILLWRVKIDKNGIMYANISIENFRRIKQICKKTKCKVYIKRKKGMPFFIHRYKKRKILIIGLIILLAIIFTLSNFVWNIEIVGNNRIDRDEIINNLKEEGLEIGKLKKNIDKSGVINNIRLKRSDISWMGISIKGTNAIVEIVESDEAPNIIDNNEYCNVIADKEGVIEKISANNGTAIVKKGDVVKKGDILIAGSMEGKYTGIRYVHAIGNIQAKVWYADKETVRFNENIKERTGKNETKYQIKINNFKINLYKTLSKFEKYDTIYKKQNVKIFSDFYLPIEIIKCNNYEVVEREKNNTVEEAKNIAIEKIENKLLNKINDNSNIVNKNINVNETPESIEVEVIYEVLENIGTEEKIVF